MSETQHEAVADYNMTETLATQPSDNCSAHATVNWWLTDTGVRVVYMVQGSHCSHDFSMTPDINFQALNVDISSYHYTLHDISLTVILHAIN